MINVGSCSLLHVTIPAIAGFTGEVRRQAQKNKKKSYQLDIKRRQSFLRMKFRASICCNQEQLSGLSFQGAANRWELELLPLPRAVGNALLVGAHSFSQVYHE